MAEYNLESLLKLKALKQAMQRVNDKFATKESVSELSEKVGNIVESGGEPNTIEEIKVNGVKQEIGEDKSVNINVPKDTSELTNNAGYQNAADVATAVTSGINEWAEKATANETIDTFKELIDYVAKHAPEAANMAADIDALEKLVGEDSVSDQIEDALAEYVKKDGGKQLSTEDFTAELKEKLSNISDNANNYIHPTSTAGVKTSGLYKITTDEYGHIVDAVEVTKEDITSLDIPAQDTTYNDATSSVSGLMSASDKQKLDSMVIATDDDVENMLNEILPANE